MSSVRLNITKKMIETLGKIKDMLLAYKEEHKPEYELQLEKPLREIRGDTSVDFVDDFTNSYVLIKYFMGEVEQYKDKLHFQIGYAKNFQPLFQKLSQEVGLFGKIAESNEAVKAVWDEAKNELDRVSKEAEELLSLKK